MKKAAQATPNQQLKQERERRCWSQLEVADRIGTTSLNVSRWERGITFPTPHFRQELCTLFGKSAIELGLSQDEITDHERVSEQEVQLSAAEAVGSQPESEAERPWNVPFGRNPYFTGRGQLLERLHEQLHNAQHAALNQPQALTGLGGIGKTQIAIEYAFSYREFYSAVFWLLPEEIVTEGAAELGAVLAPVAADPLLLNRAIQVLRRYPLVKRDPDARLLYLHRLVQVVLKEQMDGPEQRAWAEHTGREPRLSRD